MDNVKPMSDKYSLPMRIMHWLFAVIILGLIALGWYMTRLDNNVSYKYELYNLHKSFGVLILLLLPVRLVIRWTSRIPPPPKNMPLAEQKHGKLSYVLLYVFMFVVPASGYLMSDANGRNVPFFNVVMPTLIGKNSELGGYLSYTHVILAYTFLALITLHVLAVIKYRFFDKPENDILQRMI